MRQQHPTHRHAFGSLESYREAFYEEMAQMSVVSIDGIAGMPTTEIVNKCPLPLKVSK